MRHTAQLADARSPLPSLGDVLDFMRLIWAVDHGLQRSSKRMEKATGITSPQRLVIRIVGRFPGISAGHLATLLHVHPGTLTSTLKRLEHGGLIRRRPDPRDGRRCLVGLTKAGHQFDIETEGVIESAISRILASTPPEKLQAAREVLESIATSLAGPEVVEE